MRIVAASILISGSVLAGCATVQPRAIDASAMAGFSGETVSYTIREKPSFSAMTAGKAAFAILGAAAMISEGNQIIADNEVPDPAQDIGAGIAQLAQDQLGARLVLPPSAVSGNDAAALARTLKSKSRFVVDTQTMGWMFGYFPTNWSHYRVTYIATARLIDTQSATVVAEGSCKLIPDSDAGAPTYDELLANHAALLKETLAADARTCTESLAHQMLPAVHHG